MLTLDCHLHETYCTWINRKRLRGKRRALQFGEEGRRSKVTPMGKRLDRGRDIGISEGT